MRHPHLIIVLAEAAAAVSALGLTHNAVSTAPTDFTISGSPPPHFRLPPPQRTIPHSSFRSLSAEYNSSGHKQHRGYARTPPADDGRTRGRASALQVAAVVLRALARVGHAPPPPRMAGFPDGSGTWRVAARDLAAALLVGDRLPTLFAGQEGALLGTSIVRELEGLRCVQIQPDCDDGGTLTNPTDDVGSGVPHVLLLKEPGNVVEQTLGPDYLKIPARQHAASFVDKPSYQNDHGDAARDNLGHMPSVGSSEREALLAAFVRDPHTAAAWAALQGWRDDAGDPCGREGLALWTGVSCSSAGRVVTVDFQGQSELGFELSAAATGLGALTSLRHLDLSQTGLSGTLPGDALQSLAAMEYLRVEVTSVSGTIPDELGGLVALQELYLGSNPSMSGTLPAALGRLPQVQNLVLRANSRLSGTIPPIIGALPKVIGLILKGPSLLSGTIPAELGQLTQLLTCDLGNNPSLSGTIPGLLGNLSQLQQLSISRSPSLSGTVPSAMGKLLRLQKLYFVSNPSLSGTIPAQLGLLRQLQELSWYINPVLSGTIPPELGQLTNLQGLDLNSNALLSGTTPAQLGDLKQLKLASLNGMPLLSGTLPVEFGKLIKLEKLDLYESFAISGTIPAEFGKLPQLTRIFIYSMSSLSGTIPAELGNLSRLQILHVHSNPLLSGTLPTTLTNLGSLQFMNMYSNPQLSGTIPALYNCSALLAVNLGNCSLTGLPASLPASLVEVNLNNNPFNATAVRLSLLLSTLPSLHVLDVGFMNVPTVLSYHDDGVCHGCHGTRVIKPASCNIGAPCSFKLFMYDAEDRRVHIGGTVSGLTLHFNGSSVAMTDNRDGSFTAAIPIDWVHRTGSHLFHFFHDDNEFFPMVTGFNTLALAFDCGQVGGKCTGLRTIKFLPRQCAYSSHTVADVATGSVCRCREGFTKDSSNDKSILTCHRRCRTSERVSNDGTSCECADGYNTDTYGILVCSPGGLDLARHSSMLREANIIRSRGGRCLPCPTECAICDDGAVSLRQGWRLNSTDSATLAKLLAQGRGGLLQYVFNCPFAI
eukprot:COSAG01_NODE_6759_length_3511_cov_1.924091_1_plen_1047_part_10